MIERWWLLATGLSLALMLFILFCRFGAAPRKSLRHPLVGLLMQRLPYARSLRRLPACILCGALTAVVIAASGFRWGITTFPDFREVRVIALTIDRSGSISEEQEKLFVLAAEDFLQDFKESAAVTIVPFADQARPSPIFTLSISREYQNALTYLHNLNKIPVGGGTEGAQALYQSFWQIMVPSKISADVMRDKIRPWLLRRETRLHEEELGSFCRVGDRAVIVKTDAEFSEGDLNSAEVLELYRICGVRAYFLVVKGKDVAYLHAAVETTRGRFEVVPDNLSGNREEFEKTVRTFFRDILTIERSPQKVREAVIRTPRSWIFSLAGFLLGFLAAAIEAVRIFQRYRLSAGKRRLVK